MNFAVGMITAPRPEPTIDRCLASLRAAGFEHVSIFCDTTQSGSWPNWYRALTCLLHFPADTILLVEDDAVFCQGLREHLERTLWPAGNCALCSPYSPTPYNEHEDVPGGWHEENRGYHLVGSICWALPRESAQAIVRDLAYAKRATKSIDLRIGMWAADTGRSVWYHKPSLAQHIGSGNSALGRANDAEDPLRMAGDFIGEDRFP
ncbi:MAG: hypothetical protein ACYS5V_00040 [Planctomycetota bacterium]|jgi:hypothetical protein